jgi:hypothetical protein
MLAYAIGELAESLTQADFRGLTGYRWCEASIEVPIFAGEGRFISFGEATLMSPQPVSPPLPAVKNPVKAAKIAEVVHAVQTCYRAFLRGHAGAIGPRTITVDPAPWISP